MAIKLKCQRKAPDTLGNILYIAALGTKPLPSGTFYCNLLICSVIAWIVLAKPISSSIETWSWYIKLRIHTVSYICCARGHMPVTRGGK